MSGFSEVVSVYVEERDAWTKPRKSKVGSGTKKPSSDGTREDDHFPDQEKPTNKQVVILCQAIA